VRCHDFVNELSDFRCPRCATQTLQYSEFGKTMTPSLAVSAELCHRFSLPVAEGLWLVESNDEHFARTLTQKNAIPPKKSAHELWLRVQVIDSASSLEPTHFRGMGHLVFCRYGANLFVFDLHRKRVDALISRAAAQNRELWTTIWLPLILGVMASSIGVLPLHSACVVSNGRGILIAGESMAGKSTLCVALAKNGFQLLSDDWTYVRTKGDVSECCGLQVPVKLLPDAVLHYPELTAYIPARTANGEIAYELPGNALGVQYASTCIPEALIFLERSASGAPSFIPAEQHYVEQYISNSVERLPFELSHAEEARRSAILLMSGLPAWTFSYSGSPQAGARALADLLATNARGTRP
jgi:hypothetical protein